MGAVGNLKSYVDADQRYRTSYIMKLIVNFNKGMFWHECDNLTLMNQNGKCNLTANSIDSLER